MRAPRLTGRGQAFLAAGATITVVAMLFGFPDLTRVGVLLLGLPVLSLLAGARRAPRLEVRRWVSPTLVVPGQEADVALEVRNAGRSRSHVHLAEEQVDRALGGQVRLLLPPLEPGEARVVRYRVRGRARGSYPIGPLTVRQPDLFGLTTTRHQLPGTDQLVVLPRIERLSGTEPAAGAVPGEGPVGHMVATRGEEDVTTRPYREGDDLRRVHWPATAHRGTLMVRQEEHPAARRAVLTLDARRSAMGGDDLEWAVSALASVAVLLDARGYALHLHAPGAPAHDPLPLEAVLRRLAVLELADAEVAPLRPAGLVVAAVAAGTRTAEVLARIAPDRGSTGILFLLAGDDSTAALARAGGWRTHRVASADPVRSAWDAARLDDRVMA